MKKSTIVLFLFLSANLFSQVISGDWKGILYQPSNYSYSEYPFSLHLEQKGSTISGTSRISLSEDASIFGLMKIEGTFNKNELYFKELKIINENKANYNFTWCIKTGTLQYLKQNGFAILSGNWKGTQNQQCQPGTIYLKRKIKRPIILDNPEKTVVIERNEQSKNHKIKHKKPISKKDSNQEEGKNVAAQKQIIVKDSVKIEKRDLKEGKIIQIPQKKITITVFDAAKDDGDTISLIFNDKIILSEYRLTKKPYKINLLFNNELAENKLVLYAHNVGKIPPNTAELIIKSGNLNQKIILKSNLKESDIIYFKMKRP